MLFLQPLILILNSPIYYDTTCVSWGASLTTILAEAVFWSALSAFIERTTSSEAVSQWSHTATEAFIIVLSGGYVKLQPFGFAKCLSTSDLVLLLTISPSLNWPSLPWNAFSFCQCCFCLRKSDLVNDFLLSSSLPVSGLGANGSIIMMHTPVTTVSGVHIILSGAESIFTSVEESHSRQRLPLNTMTSSTNTPIPIAPCTLNQILAYFPRGSHLGLPSAGKLDWISEQPWPFRFPAEPLATIGESPFMMASLAGPQSQTNLVGCETSGLSDLKLMLVTTSFLQMKVGSAFESRAIWVNTKSSCQTSGHRTTRRHLVWAWNWPTLSPARCWRMVLPGIESTISVPIQIDELNHGLDECSINNFAAAFAFHSPTCTTSEAFPHRWRRRMAWLAAIRRCKSQYFPTMATTKWVRN